MFTQPDREYQGVINSKRGFGAYTLRKGFLLPPWASSRENGIKAPKAADPLTHYFSMGQFCRKRENGDFWRQMRQSVTGSYCNDPVSRVPKLNAQRNRRPTKRSGVDAVVRPNIHLLRASPSLMLLPAENARFILHFFSLAPRLKPHEGQEMSRRVSLMFRSLRM